MFSLGCYSHYTWGSSFRILFLLAHCSSYNQDIFSPSWSLVSHGLGDFTIPTCCQDSVTLFSWSSSLDFVLFGQFVLSFKFCRTTHGHTRRDLRTYVWIPQTPLVSCLRSATRDRHPSWCIRSQPPVSVSCGQQVYTSCLGSLIRELRPMSKLD